MILVSEAGSICRSGLAAASTWPLLASMVIQARAAMVGAGTDDNSATGVVPAAAGAVPAAGAAGCCCAQAGADATINADNTAPANARRENATEDGRARFFFIGKSNPRSRAAQTGRKLHHYRQGVGLRGGDKCSAPRPTGNAMLPGARSPPRLIQRHFQARLHQRAQHQQLAMEEMRGAR